MHPLPRPGRLVVPPRRVVLALVLGLARACGAGEPAATDAAWQRHEFTREGFACSLPGVPRPLDAEGATRFQVAVELTEPPAILVARLRDMPARAAGKAEPFFDTVVEQMQATGKTVLGREGANLGPHRGCIVAARRPDGAIEIVRSVVVGWKVYELHALLPPDHGAETREIVDRFFESLELVH